MADAFDAGRWAAQVFAAGYHAGATPRPEHQDQTPNDLAEVSKRVRIEKFQLEATWKVLRDVALLSRQDGSLAPEQRAALEGLKDSEQLPADLRTILDHAFRALKTTSDLHVLTFIFVAAWERY